MTYVHSCLQLAILITTLGTNNSSQSDVVLELIFFGQTKPDSSAAQGVFARRFKYHWLRVQMWSPCRIVCISWKLLVFQYTYIYISDLKTTHLYELYNLTSTPRHWVCISWKLLEFQYILPIFQIYKVHIVSNYTIWWTV